jgi:hypothetical protein
MKKILKLFLSASFVLLILVSFSRSSFAEEAAGATVTVVDLKIAKDIVEREPVGISNTFPANVGKLYCFSRLKVDVDATSIFHSWYFNDEKVTQVELNVKKSGGFRTYSSKTIMENQKGKWEVEVLDTEGNVLKSITFTIN